MYVVELTIGILLTIFGLLTGAYIVYSSISRSQRLPVMQLSEAAATVAIGVFYIVCSILILNNGTGTDLEISGTDQRPVNLTFVEPETHPEDLFDTENFYSAERPTEVIEDVRSENTSEVVDKFLVNYQKFFNDIINRRVKNDSIKNFYYNNELYNGQKMKRSLRDKEDDVCDYQELYLKYVMLVASFVYGLMSVVNSAVECKVGEGDGFVDTDAETIDQGGGGDGTAFVKKDLTGGRHKHEGEDAFMKQELTEGTGKLFIKHPPAGAVKMDNKLFVKRNSLIGFEGGEQEGTTSGTDGRSKRQSGSDVRSVNDDGFPVNRNGFDDGENIFENSAKRENDRTILVKSNGPKAAIIETRNDLNEQNIFGSKNILDTDSVDGNADKSKGSRNSLESVHFGGTKTGAKVHIDPAKKSSTDQHGIFETFETVPPGTKVNQNYGSNGSETKTDCKKTLQLLFTWSITILYTVLVYFTMKTETVTLITPQKPLDIKPQASDIINLIEKPINVSTTDGKTVNEIIDKIYLIVASAQANDTKTTERQTYPSIMFDIIKYFNSRQRKGLEFGCDYKSMPIKLHTLLTFVVAYVGVLFYTKNKHTRLDASGDGCGKTKRLGRNIMAFAGLWLPSVFEVFTRAYLMNYQPNVVSDVCLAVGNISRFIANGMNVKGIKDELAKMNGVNPAA